MRRPLLALVAVLAATVARAQTVERVHVKGADVQITVPAAWNGSLFIYAHGYTADRRILGPIPPVVSDAVPVLWPALLPFVPPGYATAITTFRSIGWDVKDA